MFKRRLFYNKKTKATPPRTLAQVEAELEIARDETEKLEKSEPPYDTDDPSGSWGKYKAHMQPAWDKERKLDRERRMLMTPEFEDLSDFGDVMTLEHWIECVNDGGFIDYDGFGRYVRDGKESNIDVHPSDVEHNSVRDDFDTVIWFNR